MLRYSVFLCVLLFGYNYDSASIGYVLQERIYPRIVGGQPTTIDKYPTTAAVLYNYGYSNGVYYHHCGGSILTSRIVLTAAHCFVTIYGLLEAPHFAVRVGSSYTSSGGTLHTITKYVYHENFDLTTVVNDVALMLSSTSFVFSDVVVPASISSLLYDIPNNASVTAVGWGRLYADGPLPEQLQEVEIYAISQEDCRGKYGESVITEDMLCSGILGVGGKDQCQGDSGGPLYHNGVVVGVCSWGIGCASAAYPGVNARVSSHSRWILNTLTALK